MANPTTWLPPLLGTIFRRKGTDYAKRSAVNFSGNVRVVDNAVTRAIDITPIRLPWTTVSHAISPYTATSTTVWLALDLTGGAIVVNLPHAADGDLVILVDANGAATGAHTLTLNGSAQNIANPEGGTFTSSKVYSTSGFMLRFKFFSVVGAWLPW